MTEGLDLDKVVRAGSGVKPVSEGESVAFLENGLFKWNEEGKAKGVAGVGTRWRQHRRVCRIKGYPRARELFVWLNLGWSLPVAGAPLTLTLAGNPLGSRPGLGQGRMPGVTSEAALTARPPLGAISR